MSAGAADNPSVSRYSGPRADQFTRVTLRDDQRDRMVEHIRLGERLGRMSHVELGPEQECLAFRPVVVLGTPELVVPVRLAQEYDPVAEVNRIRRGKLTSGVPSDSVASVTPGPPGYPPPRIARRS